MNMYTLDDSRFQFIGRIDREGKEATLCWPGSQIRFRFRGTAISISGENINFGPDTLIGAIIDGKEEKYLIGRSCEFSIIIAEHLEDTEHDVVIYKRMEGHYLTLRAVSIEGELLDPSPLPSKRIEVYGDSVSAGSVVDCYDHVGKADPPHYGNFDNAWHAYPQLIAERLPATVFDTSQGGIAIFDNTGWFEMPNTRGVESCYDKIKYSSYLPQKLWDWSFKPHVIIMAVGQNDANPDPDCLRKPDYYEKWVGKYMEIINDIRSHSPKAAVILALTVLEHDPMWDDALDDIARRLGGQKNSVYHFMYTRTGKATPGHPRLSEQIEMADELCVFLNSLPEEIWTD